MKTQTYKDLIVWNKAKQLAVLIYGLTDKYPKSEQFGLISQMRRAAISISSNIAESYHRFHPKEKNQFLAIAFGSAAELESQKEVSKEIFPNLDYSKTEECLQEVLRILNKFLQ